MVRCRGATSHSTLAILGRSQMLDRINRVERATTDGPYLSCGVPLCGTYGSLIPTTDRERLGRLDAARNVHLGDCRSVVSQSSAGICRWIGR